MDVSNREENSSVQLRVASLNCWGLIWAKDKKKRFQYISKYLLEPKVEFDLVALQEVWCRADYETLRQSVINVYPYSIYFPSGVIGSGLAILSKLPIIRSYFMRFTLCGAPDRFWHGDFYSGKGVGGVRVDLNGQLINFYSTHLHAEYGKKKVTYQAHRLTQLAELCQFVEQTSNGYPAIVGGDLNTQPNDFVYKTMLALGCANLRENATPYLTDAWSDFRPTDPLEIVETTTITTTTTTNNTTTNNTTTNNNPNTVITTIDPTNVISNESTSGGFTFNLPSNAYCNKGHVRERIDYFLFSKLDGAVKCTQVMVVTEDSSYEAGISFSDHQMITAMFLIDRQKISTAVLPSRLPMSPEEIAERKLVVEEAIDVLTKKRHRVIQWQKFYIAVAIVFLLIFIGITIATAVTIPNDQLTPILILALFGIQPAVLVTMFSGIIMAGLFLQEERAALSHFIDEWNLWLIRYKQFGENELVLQDS